MIEEHVMFDAIQTAYLVKARAALVNPIPGDATFLATVATLLRSLIDQELLSEDRIAADKANAEENARIAAERASPEYQARQAARAAEQATPEYKAREAELEIKRQQALAALAVKHKEEQSQLAIAQDEERARAIDQGVPDGYVEPMPPLNPPPVPVGQVAPAPPA